MEKIKIRVDHILTVESVIDIINIKRFDCVNYDDCLDEVVFQDLEDEKENFDWKDIKAINKLKNIYNWPNEEIIFHTGKSLHYITSRLYLFENSSMNLKCMLKDKKISRIEAERIIDVCEGNTVKQDEILANFKTDKRDHVWACSLSCPSYKKNIESEKHLIYKFSNNDIEKVSSEIDRMTMKEKFKFFIEQIRCKQNFEKYTGGFLVEEYTDTTISDTRTKQFKSGRTDRNKK